MSDFESKSFIEQDIEVDFFNRAADINTSYACCCQGDKPIHDESQKFILMGNPEAWKTPLFKYKRSGKISVENE